MTTMKYISIILILLIVFTISCVKEDNKPCPSKFVVNGEVIPYAKTYNVGDTINLQAIYNSMIYDRVTKEYYNLENLNIEVGFTVYKIDTLKNNSPHKINEYVNVILNSKYNYYIQNFDNGNSSLFSNIIHNADTFKNEIKLVLKKKGLFMLSYGPFANECNQDFEGKCIDYQLGTRLNIKRDNNINLLKESQDDFFNTWMFIDTNRFFWQKSGFAYRVID